MIKLRERVRSGGLGTLMHIEATMSVPNALVLEPSAWRASRAEAPCGGLAPPGEMVHGAAVTEAVVRSAASGSVERVG